MKEKCTKSRRFFFFFFFSFVRNRHASERERDWGFGDIRFGGKIFFFFPPLLFLFWGCRSYTLKKLFVEINNVFLVFFFFFGLFSRLKKNHGFDVGAAEGFGLLGLLRRFLKRITLGGPPTTWHGFQRGSFLHLLSYTFLEPTNEKASEINK